MEASTLNCPMCGASARSDATKCEHCGARLATVACPSCFGMIFLGSRYCSHCGAQAQRQATGTSRNLCPHCKVNLENVSIGGTWLEECPGCAGIWTTVPALERIQQSREEQAAVLGFAQPIVEPPGSIQPVRYVPCPVCQKLMNRVNFARCSKVVVDICKGHGTWFDRDELRRIVEFIQSGGLEQARAKQLAELEEKERRLQAAQTNASEGYSEIPRRHAGLETGLSSAARLVLKLFDV